jgi:hypothetical protein
MSQPLDVKMPSLLPCGKLENNIIIKSKISEKFEEMYSSRKVSQWRMCLNPRKKLVNIKVVCDIKVKDDLDELFQEYQNIKGSATQEEMAKSMGLA